LSFSTLPRRAFRLRLLAVALGLGLGLGLTVGLSGLAQAAQPGVIRIGVAEALTGGAAQYGLSIRNGFQLAADQINAAGGVGGAKIELVVEDEQGKKEEAINAFKKLIFQDQVLMLFGPTLSNSAQAADPIAQAAKVVVFGTSNTADGITSIGDHVFRNSVTEADVLPVTLRTAAQHAHITKVAVLYGNDDVFTKSGYDNFKKALEALKIPVTTTETFAKGDVDFKAQLTKIKASHPDAIVLSALLAEGAPIMVQARQLGLNLPFIGGNGMNSVKVFDLAKGASDDLWVGSPWSIENRAPANNSFIVAYTQKFKSAPDQFAAQAYDALNVVAAALKTAKLSGNLAADRQALRDALPGVKWTGATGAFAFRRAQDKAGRPAGYDADQLPIISVTHGVRYEIVK
jgi:branched-chain amino acid transport system substrate-binding protein